MNKLTKEQRKEVVRRRLAGETYSSIAADFGVSKQAIFVIVRDATDPEKKKKIAERRLKRRLTEAELEEFKRVLEETGPEDHGFFHRTVPWKMEFGFQLAEKLFGKKPSVRAMEEVMEPFLIKPKEDEDWDVKPQPPEPFDIRDLEPEFAEDEDFVEYCRSPLAEQIRWREYEAALREWEERNAQRQETKNQAAVKKAVGKRTGKYAGGRGSRFTPKKKRRR